MDYKDIFYHLDIIASIALILFAVTVLVQLIYYLIVYTRVVYYKEKPETNGIQPVSVIICARNEEENLFQNLTSVLEQDYPLFEVVVVNVCSEDNTEEVLAEFKKKYPNLRSTIIKKDGSFSNLKKFAATVGIKASQYEWLLFTDSDCRPESRQWIASMNRYFVDKKDIVLGYGGYSVQKGLLNKWIRYDTCFTALQYFGFALMKKTYTGIGRNLAYRKSLFFAHNGFAAHAHIISGDDDLFVNKAAKKRNVAVTCIEDSHTRSKQKITFKEWIWQRSKRITSSRYYRDSQLFWLTLEPVSRILLWGTFCVLMVFCPFWQYVLAVFTVRMLVFMWIIRAAVKKFKEPGILQHAIFFDFLMPFVYLYIFLLNRISSKYSKWK